MTNNTNSKATTAKKQLRKAHKFTIYPSLQWARKPKRISLDIMPRSFTTVDRIGGRSGSPKSVFGTSVKMPTKFHEFFVIFDYSLYGYPKFVGIIRINSKYSRSRSQEAKMVLELLGTKYLNKQWSKQIHQGWNSTCLVSDTLTPKAIVGWEAEGIQGSLCMHSYWR